MKGEVTLPRQGTDKSLCPSVSVTLNYTPPQHMSMSLPGLCSGSFPLPGESSLLPGLLLEPPTLAALPSFPVLDDLSSNEFCPVQVSET